MPAVPHVVITGASSGIGAALAEAYARQAARLTLFGRDAERLNVIAARCRLHGAEVEVVLADVSDEDAMRPALVTADERVPIDIVIANAGIAERDSEVGEMRGRRALAAQVIRVNLLGVVHTVAPLADRFVARRSGHIVLVASLAGYLALPHAPAYTASKAAVRAYGHALRRSLRGSGVDVTVVSPGFVHTPLMASSTYRMPLAWSAERAAQGILRGLKRRKREIAFPWPIALAVRLMSHLPLWAADPLLAFVHGARFRKPK